MGVAGAGGDVGGAGAGSGVGAAGEESGVGAEIEIGGHEVWETVFVGDEIIEYVDSSFSMKDRRHRILCSFEGAGVRDIEGRETMLVG